MKPPVVPLPILNGQLPILLLFDHRDPAVELAYERAPLVGGSRIRTATRDTTDYWVPRLTPVFAVNDGRVIYARKQSDGHVILIDHLNGWVSVYSHLVHMFVTPTRNTPVQAHVCAGDIIGYVGTPRGTPLSALRFELWRMTDKGDFMPVDPVLFIRRWQHVDWRDARLARQANDAAAR